MIALWISSFTMWYKSAITCSHIILVYQYTQHKSWKSNKHSLYEIDKFWFGGVFHCAAIVHQHSGLNSHCDPTIQRQHQDSIISVQWVGKVTHTASGFSVMGYPASDKSPVYEMRGGGGINPVQTIFSPSDTLWEHPNVLTNTWGNSFSSPGRTVRRGTTESLAGEGMRLISGEWSGNPIFGNN